MLFIHMLICLFHNFFPPQGEGSLLLTNLAKGISSCSMEESYSLVKKAASWKLKPPVDIVFSFNLRGGNSGKLILFLVPQAPLLVAEVKNVLSYGDGKMPTSFYRWTIGHAQLRHKYVHYPG